MGRAQPLCTLGSPVGRAQPYASVHGVPDGQGSAVCTLLQDPHWAGLSLLHLSPESVRRLPASPVRPTYLARGHLLLLGDP